MKKTTSFLLFIAFASLLSCNKRDAGSRTQADPPPPVDPVEDEPQMQAAPPAPPAGKTWQLVVNEDFNSFNTSIWGKGGTPWGTESHDGSCNLQLAEDGWVSGGNLYVRSRKGPFRGASGKSYPYSGCYVWTKTRRTYGYLEIRAQYPTTVRGTWPAFWMLGEGWPPEIDIAEYRGAPENTMHLAYYDGNWNSTRRPGNYAGWHTYGLLWEANSLKYYMDGQLLKTVNKAPSIPMYVILSNGVACDDVNGTGFPNNYVIDYFRWYQAR